MLVRFLGPVVMAAFVLLAGSAGLCAVDPPAEIAVPFDLTENHVFVPVYVNGKGPFTFAFDTGAANTISTEAAASIGLHGGRTYQIGGVGEGAQAASDTTARMSVGDARFTGTRFTITALDMIRRADGFPRLDGLIGYEVLNRYVVSVDYPQRRLVLRLPESYTPPQDALPLRFFGTVPVIDAAVDGVRGKFAIDTGDGFDLSFTTGSITAHDLIERYHNRVREQSGYGFGGPVLGDVTRAGELTIGPYHVAQPLARLPHMSAGFFHTSELAGSIGGGVCRRFRVTLDYARRLIAFEPGPVLPRDVFDRSGMAVVIAPGGFEVSDVLPGGPAERAGVQLHDLISAIDGEPAVLLDAPSLHQRLQAAPGTSVRLALQRAGQSVAASVVLRDLI